MIHGANHDVNHCDKPAVFVIDRSPNPHLTFNYGIHFCLGAPLARLEGDVAVGAVAHHMPDLQLVQDQHDYMDTMVMRGVWSMPVRQG